MFTVTTLVPMCTIISPGPYTQSKQSKSFHGKCNLKVNCDKKMSLLTKIDCVIVTNLNHTVRHVCHVVVFNCFWLQNCKKQFCATTWPITSTFASKSRWKNKKLVSMHSNGVCLTVGYKKNCESWQINCVFRLFSSLSTQIMEFEDKQANKCVRHES